MSSECVSSALQSLPETQSFVATRSVKNAKKINIQYLQLHLRNLQLHLYNFYLYLHLHWLDSPQDCHTERRLSITGHFLDLRETGIALFWTFKNVFLNFLSSVCFIIFFYFVKPNN